jgi:hypothetical protein
MGMRRNRHPPCREPASPEPQFKLFVAGNHKPGLRRVDEAIRRRLNLVPFTITDAGPFGLQLLGQTGVALGCRDPCGG